MMIFYMQFEVTGIIESLLAVVTVIPKLVTMNPAVGLKMKSRFKEFPANVTFEWPFIAVGRSVLVQVLPSPVPSTAYHAQMRKIQSVSSLVYLQPLQLSETFPTVLTDVRFHLRVYLHVTRIVGHVTEVPSADFALGHDDPFMNATNMCVQQVNLFELLCAHMANQRFRRFFVS